MMLLFAWVLRGYPLKPMQIQAGLQNNSLKPIQNASTNGARAIEYRSKAVKTHMPAHKRLTPRVAERKHMWIPAPGSTSDKNNAPHAPAQLRLARSHGTHETKTKTKRSRSPGFRGRAQGPTRSPKPPINIHINRRFRGKRT